MTADRVLRIAAAIILDAEGRMLVVRKTGTTAFMQPGGKLEPGESGAECLARELAEELALDVAPDELVPVGRFAAPAANEAGWSVDCDVFRVTDFETPPAAAPQSKDFETPPAAAPQPASARIAVQAELAEARWATRAELEALAREDLLAPLTRDNLDAFLAR